MTKTKAYLAATAEYLPPKVLTNADLEKQVETSDEWIVTRTGIKERRIASPNEASAAMGAKAAKKLLSKNKVDPLEIDLIIVATMTPDYLVPSTAALVQAEIGAKNAAAFDLQAACSGFLYGINVAKAFIESKTYRKVLLIGAEKMSAFVDYTDRNTCILFGDGAAAALLQSEKPKGGFEIVNAALGADGSYLRLGFTPAGGSLHPPTLKTVEKREHFFKMEGRELFKHAVRKMCEAAQQCLKEAGLKETDINWVVPHQANTRILEAVGKGLGIPDEKIYRTLEKYGNTSAASVGITLDELSRDHPFKDNEWILLLAFGFGLTWGAALLKFRKLRDVGHSD
jgi:3-oxoacyl-[acyl-carrier-protein] synthase-3